MGGEARGILWDQLRSNFVTKYMCSNFIAASFDIAVEGDLFAFGQYQYLSLIGHSLRRSFGDCIQFPMCLC